MAEKKFVVLGGVKGGLLAFVICTVAVLVTALFAKWFNLSQTTLNIVGQAVKVAAVFAAVLIAVRDGAYVPKALLVAVVFCIASTVCSLIAGGSFSFGHVMLDLVIAVAAAVIAALIKSKRA